MCINSDCGCICISFSAHNFGLMNYTSILGSSALRELAETMPTTPAEILNIDGFPAQIYYKYGGERFLEVTQKYKAQKSSK